MTQTKSLIQRYLVGLVLEACIVATLNTAALLLLGIEYAVLLGIVGALPMSSPSSAESWRWRCR